VEKQRIVHDVALDLRYVKQYHEVTLPVPRDAGVDAMKQAFHEEHDRLYGYRLDETDLELINVRVRSVGEVDKPMIPELENDGTDAAGARKGTRRAYLPEDDAFEEIDVYDGHRLKAGHFLAGPALIERADTTIFVTGAFEARVDGYGACRMTRKDRS